MPRISQKQTEDRRREILEAARRCFIAKGFHHTTMRDILRESGLSAGAVYSYFENKEALMRAVAESDRAMTRETLAASAEAPEVETAFDALLTSYSDLLRAMAADGRARMGMTVTAEAVVNPDLMGSLADIRRGLRHDLLAVAERLAKEKYGDRIDAGALAELLLSIYQGMLMSIALDEDPDIDAVLELLRSLRF